MNQTEVEVKQLQIELAELKPLMEKAAEETRKVIDQIAIDTVSKTLFANKGQNILLILIKNITLRLVFGGKRNQVLSLLGRPL